MVVTRSAKVLLKNLILLSQGRISKQRAILEICIPGCPCMQALGMERLWQWHSSEKEAKP